jgi:hypothetical protein
MVDKIVLFSLPNLNLTLAIPTVPVSSELASGTLAVICFSLTDLKDFLV